MTIFNLFKELKAELVGDYIYIGSRNVFFPISEKDIEKAEHLLGFPFPSQLRQFYKTIGAGALDTPYNSSQEYEAPSLTNYILPPFVVANFTKGILTWEGQHTHWMAEDVYEDLEPGDLPFFEIGDSSRFLVMKPHSENPNAVWTDGIPLKIEDSFERFIWRLYYESPWFYDDIIEDYIAAHKQS
jgi:hypothetical protein